MAFCRYSKRHDEVLKLITASVKSHLPPSYSLTVDLPDHHYTFPQHITPTDQRPDPVWWSDSNQELRMLELTISFEPNMEEAHQRKQAKYQHIVEAATEAGYDTELFALEVGSRGMTNDGELNALKDSLEVTKKEMSLMTMALMRTAILESFRIWCQRNTEQ